MKPLRLYIAGPMRGVAQFNFPLFMEVERKLVDQGHKVWNPARKDLEAGLDVTDMKGDMVEMEAVNFDLRAAIEWDLHAIVREVEGLVMLPEWRTSSGAKVEFALARFLGLKIFAWTTTGKLNKIIERMTVHV